MRVKNGPNGGKRERKKTGKENWWEECTALPYAVSTDQGSTTEI